jgi:hypothetical protein
MRKVILVPALLCAVSVVAGAQTKISAKLACEKPSVRQMAGDGSQSIMFTKSNCKWATPLVIGGSKPNETVDAAVADMSGSAARNHGYSTMVMDNGDSTFVRYEGTLQMKKDGSGTSKGTWKYVRGTGKFRGIKGSGTYKGAGATDGTGWADVIGHYSLGKGK